VRLPKNSAATSHSQLAGEPTQASLRAQNRSCDRRLSAFTKRQPISLVMLLVIAGLAPPCRCEVAAVFMDGGLERAQQLVDGTDGRVGMRGVCGLIAQRLAYIEEVSKNKWNSGMPVEDPEREQEILKDVAWKAKRFGLSPTYARHFFRLQMEASKNLEYRLNSQWREEKRGRFTKTLDLKSEIRPHLDSVDDALILALRTNWSTIASKGASAEVEACQVPSKFPQVFSLALMPLMDRSAETADLTPPLTQRVP
jgi:chorismate mutase